jgi:hypothetical protein
LNFGYEKRPKGRHVALATSPASGWEIVRPGSSQEGETAEQRAGQSYAALRWYLASVPADDSVESIDIHDAALVVVCGDPDCAGPGSSGRWVGYRGLCPKCAGYAMTLHEIAVHRERALLQLKEADGSR